MIKKFVLLSALALVVVFGVFATVNPTHAQEIETEESPVAQVMVQEAAELEYAYEYQYGEGNPEVDPIQTQTRTQLREHMDGECVGDGDQLQIRQQLHTNETQGVMRQQRLNMGDGTCTGDCTTLRQGGQGN